MTMQDRERSYYYAKSIPQSQQRGQAFCEKLARGLKRVGVEVWFDKWAIKVGESLTWQIEKGFRANDYLGLALSPDALASEWVKSEVGAAWCRQMSSRKIIVLPILYRDCELPLFLADRKIRGFSVRLRRGLYGALRGSWAEAFGGFE